MASVEIRELEKRQLDWAVSRALGNEPTFGMQFGGNWWERVTMNRLPKYSEQWRAGGPVVNLMANTGNGLVINRTHRDEVHVAYSPDDFRTYHELGPTTLVAAMRAYVAAHWVTGRVEVPDGLV